MTIKRNVPALLVASLLALGVTGCASFHDRTAKSSPAPSAEPRGPVTTVSDAGITAKVKAVLAADELVKARHIDVDTVRGIVQLNGTVNSAAEKDRALSLARGVSGVIEVKDNLKTSG